MKILIVADAYPPEVSSGAGLLEELAVGLANRRHEVIVLTTYPRHYLADKSKKQEFDECTLENGVRVIRIKTPPLKKVNFIFRGVVQIFLPWLLFLRGKKYLGSALDSVIVYSPPITLSVVGALVKKKFHARFILNLQDIFPQNAIDLGVLKNGAAIKFFEMIEKFAYNIADIITFHSSGGMKFLIEKKKIPQSKIVTLHNWIDDAPYQMPPHRDFRREYALENKFIFLFAGVIGPAQNVPFIVEVARQVREFTEIVFLLVGDGSQKSLVEQLIQKYQLSNVVIKPLVAKEEYPSLVHAADAGIICLDFKNKTPFVPGKLLGYMAGSKPTVAFLNKESDCFGVIESAQCGYTITSDDARRAADIVVRMNKLTKQDLDQMGKNGLAYARKNLSLNAALEVFEGLFRKEV